MQTISTRLDKNMAKKFLDICNDKGKCQSEMLRNMIENLCDFDNNKKIIVNKLQTNSNKIVPQPSVKFI